MRGFPLLLAVAVGGCATSDMTAPSLGRRAAEAIDPRAPVPELAVASQPSAGIVDRLGLLVAQTLAADAAFRSAAANADRLAEAAAGSQTESWIVAQQALSGAVAARAPASSALAEINELAAQRIQALGGIGAADLEAINRAAAQVAEVDSRQAATIDRIQARLAR